MRNVFRFTEGSFLLLQLFSLVPLFSQSVVELLIEHGAKVSAKDEEYIMTLDLK
jgi:hypothetical protein